MSSELATVVTEEGLEIERVKPLLAHFEPLFEKAQAMVNRAGAIVVTDATQVTEMRQARTVRLELKNVRVDVEKVRKTLKEESLRTGKAIDGMANVLKFLIEPAENRLEEMEKFAERKEAERKAALKASREELLRPYGIDMSAYVLSEMAEATFAQLLDSTRLAHEARIEAARKAEAERIAAEAARAAEEKRIREENERLRKEREAAEAAAKAERDAREKAQRKAEEAARKAKAAADAEAARIKAEAEAEAARVKAAAEAKARKEREEAARKIAEERAAREKAEAEIAARRAEEEAKARAEAEAKRKAELAPDREKLMGVAAAVLAIRVPAVRPDAAAVAVAAEIEQKLASFAAWIQNKVKSL